MSLPVGYQSWRQLLFVHWPLAPAALRPLVPAPLEIDTFDGTAYVGLVPFIVQAARPVGAPAALGLQFLETNVRTYVHLAGREPGVYFFSLDAGSLLAVIGARLSFGLPYFWAAGRHWQQRGRIEYELRRRVGRRPGCRLSYSVGQQFGPARPGTLDHFLIERYVLHVRRAGSLWSVRVRHQPYPLWQVRLHALEEQLVQAAGISTRAAGPPPLVHFASGVEVAVCAPRIRLLSRRDVRA